METHFKLHSMTQTLALFSCFHWKIEQRCCIIVCSETHKICSNKLKIRQCLDFISLHTANHVWLLVEISANYHHYLNVFGAVAITFHVVGCLKGLVHSWNLRDTKTLSAPPINRSIYGADIGKYVQYLQTTLRRSSLYLLHLSNKILTQFKLNPLC